MQATVFDAAARDLGTVSTRRSIFRLLGGATAMGSVALLTGEEALGKAKRREQDTDHARGKKHAQVDAQKKGKGKKGKGKGKGKNGKGNGNNNQGNGNGGGKGTGNGGNGASGKHFSVSGRSILDASGNPVLLRGVNTMSVYHDEDPTGAVALPEIRKTGANTVRIVWAMATDTRPSTDPAHLDALITTARANQLVPMIELHDATGNWAGLNQLVAYWTQPAIVALIAKHQEYLLVNIGNEVGNHEVTNAQFLAGYTSAVQQMRAAGIHTPLVIDAPGWGKSLDVLNATAASLLSADPERNLIFSVHLYWGQADGDIQTALQNAAAANYPLVVGEFSRAGAYDPNVGDSSCQQGGYVDYQTILEECHKLDIGWYAWEWGPGNGVGEPGCELMDMTTNGTFATLQPGWATEVATTSPYSLKNTARTIL